MTKTGNQLTYCAGCGRLIPGSELEAGLSEAQEVGVVCISCIERSDPKRAAMIREMSFREAERAKVSVQLMWAPPGVIPPRAARLAGEGTLAPGAVDPISGERGQAPVIPARGGANGGAGAQTGRAAAVGSAIGAAGATRASGTVGATGASGAGNLFQRGRWMPWWIVGVASLFMAVLGALSQRLIQRWADGRDVQPSAETQVPPQPEHDQKAGIAQPPPAPPGALAPTPPRVESLPVVPPG
ncbi:MAG: hypothetical protein ACRD2F_13145, partial [Terriglobales bacterium]